MEQPHLSSQFDYLEQKHQEDQAKIARLQQRAEAQEYKLQEQARRIQGLEEDLTAARLSLTRIPQLDERLDHLKQELLETLEQQLSRRQQTATAPAHSLAAQLDNHTKALNELRRELDKVRRYEEQISLARTEVERLNRTASTFEARLNDLGKQLDERVRATTYLEEQRRLDANRLAELQVELPDLYKKTEANRSKIQMLEQQMPQFGKYEIALEEMREEIRRHREHMDFQAAQRERQMKNWTEMAEAQARRLDEFESLMEKYGEHYQLNKRALASLQDFRESLQREQHQAEELQRLAEERQRVELEKWQADYAQRWQKQMMEWKTQSTEFQKNIDILKKQIDETAKFDQAIEKQVNLILQIIEEDIQARTTSAEDWQHRFEELADGQG